MLEENGKSIRKLEKKNNEKLQLEFKEKQK